MTVADDLKAIACMTYALVLRREQGPVACRPRAQRRGAAVYGSPMPELLTLEERHRVSHNIATLEGC